MKRQVIITTMISLLIMSVIFGVTVGVYALIVNFDTTTITLDTSKTYQTVEGFGASSAWTYQAFGKLEDDKLKEETMEMLYGDSGLELNTFRYNIGGGGAEFDYYEDPLRGAESFFIADRFDPISKDYSVFSDVNNYDFSRDAGVRELFETALAKGNIEQVVFFVNSPHYLMTKSGKTHGAKENDNNLKEECYGAFSEYVLVITNYLYENIICKYDEKIKVLISPVNEPQWKWGGEGATQEGCHYDPKALAKFYDVFYKTLCKYNALYGTFFQMDVFESGNYKMLESATKFKSYINEFSKYKWFNTIGTLSVHSYGTDLEELPRVLLKNYLDRNLKAMKVSVSEYCVMQGGVDKGIDMGLYSAKVISRDLTHINAVSWNYWLSLSKYDYEDGLLYWTENDGVDAVSATKRYYAMGHFSKFIEPGSVRIGAKYSDTFSFNGVECSAFRKTDGSLAVVVINDSKRAHKIKIDGALKNVKEIRTDAAGNWKTTVYEYADKVTVPAKSITTYILSN